MAFSFYRNSLAIWLSNGMVKPLWILWIDRSVQNQVGPEAYGTYYQWFNLTLLLAVLLDGGMANYWNQRNASEGFKAGEMFAMLRLKGILWGGYLIGTLGIAVGLGFEGTSLLWILLLGLLQGLMFLNLLWRAGLAGQQKFILEGLLSAGDKTIMILLSLPLLQGKAYWTGNIMHDFVIIQILGAMAITIVSALIYRSKMSSLLHHSEETSIREDIGLNAKKSWWQMWLPFGVLGLIMTAYFRMDVVVLRLWGNSGALDQGWYAASYRLLDAGMMLPLLLGQMWVGRFAFMERSHKDIHRLLNQSALLLTGIGLAGMFIAFPRLQEWMAWWYPTSVSHAPINPGGAQNLPVHQILGWHLGAFLPMGINVLLGSLLTAHRAFGKLIPLHAGALLLNLILLRIWVPELGAVGAAQACAVTHTAVLIAQWIIVAMEYRWNPWALLWKPIAAMSLVGFITVYSFAFMNNPLELWQESLVTGAGLALVWGWTFTKNNHFV
ncbi:MAG: hypothetical protein FJ343_06500 [Sphingomonadales bacterium]|nr:hypothetical protein [Sphingomonadales bacterium]